MTGGDLGSARGSLLAPEEEHLSARDLIVRAAADSLLENGYSGTTVRAIASRANVAIGNLQYYFPTKSELLVEAWRYLTARSVEELRTALNQLTDPLEVLSVGVESIWDSLRRLGDVQLAAFDLLVQAPKHERLQAYLPYRHRHRDGRVALAAALVETGVTLQGLGGRGAPAGELLIGDLCLARASRLLADAGDQDLQVAFARAVERVAAESAAGAPV